MTTHPSTPGPLRVVTVDDEPLARDCIRIALAREPGWRIVAECGGGPAGVQAIEREAPDLVFLDVQMPGMVGFGVIEAVGPERMPATIFVTAFEEHALRAFQVHALDYLLKPFGDDRFHQALQHARRRIHTERRGELGARLEADGKYVRLHAGGRTHLIRGSLAATAERLDPAHFVRIHRGTVVNVSRIREVQPWMGGDHLAILRDGTRLRVSRTHRGALLRPDL